MAKAKKKTAPLWKLGRVKRPDAVGTLYNAIYTKTGREHWGIPTHKKELAERRVQFLNWIEQRPIRGRGFTPYELLDHIATQFERPTKGTLRHIHNSIIDGGGFVPPDAFG